MADKTDKAPDKPGPLDPKQIAKDRKAELDRQQAVTDAVESVTRDKDGNPIPILAPEA